MSAPATARAPSRWTTRANALSALRLAAAPLLALAILEGAPPWAALLFGLAVATDLLDGRVARRFGEVSPLGGLLDHASDATVVTLGLGALAWQDAVPAPLPFLVALAFVQYTWDSRALAGRRLRPNPLGRLNGIAYFALLGTPLARDVLALAWPAPALVSALGWLLVASTLVSMLQRARTYAVAPSEPGE